MLKIPIPAFYFEENENGCRTVIDGMQWLTTIYDFLKDKFKLCGLQYLKKCEGCTFEQLDWKYRSRYEKQVDGKMQDKNVGEGEKVLIGRVGRHPWKKH